MGITTRHITGLFIAILIAVADQATKYLAFEYLTTLPIPVMPVTSFFNLVMVRNYGVSFGMFSNLVYGDIILTTLTIAITAALIIWLIKSDDRITISALGLIIGGAIGNITDRIRDGGVADFLDFHLAGYHWPAFNLADSAIFVGVVLIIFEPYLHKRHKGEAHENTKDSDSS